MTPFATVAGLDVAVFATVAGLAVAGGTAVAGLRVGAFVAALVGALVGALLGTISGTTVGSGAMEAGADLEIERGGRAEPLLVAVLATLSVYGKP